MNDAEIIERLREMRARRSPVELAELLDELTDGRLSQSAIILYFVRAFPDIPLDVLISSGVRG